VRRATEGRPSRGRSACGAAPRRAPSRSRPADEVALAGLDDPAESGLQGVRRLIDVVAVERVDASRRRSVSRARARRARRRRRGRPATAPTRGAAYRRRRRRARSHLAGVARARDQRAHAADGPLGENGSRRCE